MQFLFSPRCCLPLWSVLSVSQLIKMTDLFCCLVNSFLYSIHFLYKTSGYNNKRAKCRKNFATQTFFLGTFIFKMLLFHWILRAGLCHAKESWAGLSDYSLQAAGHCKSNSLALWVSSKETPANQQWQSMWTGFLFFSLKINILFKEDLLFYNRPYSVK